MITKPLSIRVPVDVIGHIDRMAKKTGTTRTAIITDALAAHSSMAVIKEYQQGGSLQTYMESEMLEDLFKTAGCTTIGIGVYSVVRSLMDNAKDESGKKKFNETEGIVVATLSGIGVALAAMGLINALTKES